MVIIRGQNDNKAWRREKSGQTSSFLSPKSSKSKHTLQHIISIKVQPSNLPAPPHLCLFLQSNLLIPCLQNLFPSCLKHSAWSTWSQKGLTIKFYVDDYVLFILSVCSIFRSSVCPIVCWPTCKLQTSLSNIAVTEDFSLRWHSCF